MTQVGNIGNPRASDPAHYAAAVTPSDTADLAAASTAIFIGGGGNLRVTMLGGGIVTFEPGARTAWHTHPLGQTLIVTSGTGWVQREGGPVEEIRTGDVVWIPPGVRHWHGATATTPMSHVAIAESLDGKSVDWMEQVPEQQYRRAPR